MVSNSTSDAVMRNDTVILLIEGIIYTLFFVIEVTAATSILRSIISATKGELFDFGAIDFTYNFEAILLYVEVGICILTIFMKDVHAFGLVQMLINDGLLLWRAYVLSPSKKWILILPFLMLSGSCVVSCGANLVTTCLISHVYWVHKKDMTRFLNGANRRTKAGSVLSIMVTTGVILLVLQAIFLPLNYLQDQLSYFAAVFCGIYMGFLCYIINTSSPPLPFQKNTNALKITQGSPQTPCTAIQDIVIQTEEGGPLGDLGSDLRLLWSTFITEVEVIVAFGWHS
ncbi:hypothetical protein BDZ94DRAFT_1241761 [Collybia nuda]|uniref:Uncharacterized protein n=1 Tax=Collybia nuda TaxID=64659 RepID=A0A9P5XUU9_9AGAR|nr:hypothetical protein BDZ94DRAFT_1241761 [Collybia nuda]